LGPAASTSGPLSLPFNRRTPLGEDDLGPRETTAILRDVHMHEYWWMHAGDAAVRRGRPSMGAERGPRFPYELSGPCGNMGVSIVCN